MRGNFKNTQRRRVAASGCDEAHRVAVTSGESGQSRIYYDNFVATNSAIAEVRHFLSVGSVASISESDNKIREFCTEPTIVAPIRL